MDKVVMLATDRPRPRRRIDVPQSGARILFFTGVRYCRDEDAPRFGLADHRNNDPLPAVRRDLALDLAAH